MNQAVIGVGSNIEPELNVSRARERIAHRHVIIAESPLVETSPIGYVDQPDFTNGALLVETDLDRERLRADLKAIEAMLGRRPGTNRYGPRTIDLDIVVWNGAVIDRDFYTRDYLREAVLAVLPDLKL
ncbi:MAG: 2-amino-4-hydroxy-6-hydroxymethyldihydropteridine diphosphokinase [Deltaproteobacteria bacterium]|nr:2-amino-4-hydroxy-6-hydroxymethyldihydropteridine diphosphokinase [Deltaproteobacteria bacterium]